MDEAWAAYEPAGLPGTADIMVPESAKVEASFQREMKQLVDGIVASRSASLRASVEADPGNVAARNSLGVLYARYGLLDDAEAAFRAALDRGDCVPAMLNLGNVLSLRGRAQDALALYGRAAKMEPRNPTAALALARVYYGMERYDLARAQYKVLAGLDPGLAESFAYLAGALEGATRAGDTASRNPQMVWAE